MSAPGRGRPRSNEVHQRILDATLDVLADTGWAGLTTGAVAARAGVGKAAIYRRWANREGVVAAAIEEIVSEIVIPDTGSVERDLLELMTQAVRLYRGRAGRLMPGLASAMAEHPRIASAVRNGFLGPRRKALMEVLLRGIERGELRADINQELVLDFLGGAIFYRLLITGTEVNDEVAFHTVDVLMRGLGARGQF